MQKKLFLIGNGFDIAHNLKTRYLDLLYFIYLHDEETFLKFNKLLIRNFYELNGYLSDDEYYYNRPPNDVDKRKNELNIKDVQNTKEFKCLSKNFYDYEALDLYILWESLEEHMHYVLLDREVSEITIERDELRKVLNAEDYGEVIEDDIDQIGRPAQEYYDDLVFNLANEFEGNLIGWVESVDDEIVQLSNNLDFDGDDSGPDSIKLLEESFFGKDNYIVNFNYSRTIEELYSQDCLHIHGHGYGFDNDPIMGHTKNLSTFCYDKKELILVEKFYKDFDKILATNADYFKKFENVNEIIVLGMGYTDTDYFYFEKIKDIVPNAKWCMYYYLKEDHENAYKYVKKLKIANDQVTYISLKEKSPFTRTVHFYKD